MSYDFTTAHSPSCHITESNALCSLQKSCRLPFLNFYGFPRPDVGILSAGLCSCHLTSLLFWLRECLCVVVRFSRTFQLATFLSTFQTFLLRFYRAALYASVVSVIVMPSISLSVCPSHACIVRKWTKVPPTFLYRMKGKFMYFFAHKEWLMWDTPSTWNFGSNWPPASKCFENEDFQSIFACSGAAVTPSENSSIMTNGKSSTSFPMSLRWTA